MIPLFNQEKEVHHDYEQEQDQRNHHHGCGIGRHHRYQRRRGLWLASADDPGTEVPAKTDEGLSRLQPVWAEPERGELYQGELLGGDLDGRQYMLGPEMQLIRLSNHNSIIIRI